MIREAPGLGRRSREAAHRDSGGVAIGGGAHGRAAGAGGGRGAHARRAARGRAAAGRRRRHRPRRAAAGRPELLAFSVDKLTLRNESRPPRADYDFFLAAVNPNKMTALCRSGSAALPEIE